MPLETDTGRFAYRRPNLQNMPRKGLENDPVGVRAFFVPRPGYVFLDFDFSQIELRVGAYYCQDERMLNVYETGGDIHGLTTSIIFDIPFEEAINKDAEHYKEFRTAAKETNFGAFFGLFPTGLQRSLKFKYGIYKTLEECEDIINSVKKGYKGISVWQENTKKLAARLGYSETAAGRRRIMRGITSQDWGTKSFWERASLNTPIQGTAAEILKMAIVRILQGLPDRPFMTPILQVHDELLFECEIGREIEAIEFIQACMEVRPFEDFDVKIIAEGSKGFSYADLKEVGK
jgi:DNA polymerase-1